MKFSKNKNKQIPIVIFLFFVCFFSSRPSEVWATAEESDGTVSRSGNIGSANRRSLRKKRARSRANVLLFSPTELVRRRRRRLELVRKWRRLTVRGLSVSCQITLCRLFIWNTKWGHREREPSVFRVSVLKPNRCHPFEKVKAHLEMMRGSESLSPEYERSARRVPFWLDEVRMRSADRGGARIEFELQK